MANRTRYTFWIDAELMQGLRRLKEHDGILESEQIRRAIADWLRKRGALKGGRKKKP
jgi:hypothetical protein